MKKNIKFKTAKELWKDKEIKTEIKFVSQILPILSLEGCEVCPQCFNSTLPKIKGSMTGRMCSVCKTIVDREGKVERIEKINK